MLDALSAVEGYTLFAGGDAGNTPQVHSAPTAIEINPHFLQSRLDSPSSAVCGQSKARFFTNVLVHEGRHAYQNLMTIVDLQSPDDLPNGPNNDDDQDFLVDSVLQPPVEVLVDSPELRTVCSDQNDNLFEARYLGDAAADNPGQVIFAKEMDAHVFDSLHVN